uniref:Putative helicase n=1 Tax=viral metagenome TaxID=1070528 RepID=A0A6H1ZHP2_9ZZZZ
MEDKVFSYKESFDFSIERVIGRCSIPVSTLGIGEAIGDLNDDDFVVITARGGVGKTWMLLQLARDLAVFNKKIAFFSGEMSLEEIMLQRLAWMSPETKPLADKNVLPSQKKIIIEKIPNLPMWFPNITERWTFRETCIPVMDLLREKHEVEIFFFDHLRFFMNVDPANARTQERLITEQTVLDMRLYAKKYKTPIFLAVQPSKQDSDTETTIDSMKGTSAISQDATTVIVLDRKREKSKSDEGEIIFAPFINLKIEKARHGKGNMNIKVVLDAPNGRFIEWDKGGSEIAYKISEARQIKAMKETFNP